MKPGRKRGWLARAYGEGICVAALHASGKSSVLAQGSTEYLVLLAVVLIVALVTVVLLGFFPGAGNSQIAESQVYWSGAATPFRILDAATLPSSPGSICGSSANGYEMTLQNADAEVKTVTGIRIDGSDASFCMKGAGSAASGITVSPNNKVTLDIGLDSAAYTAGKRVELGIAVIYGTKYFSNRTQNGQKKLAFMASTSSAAATACGYLPLGTKCCDFGGGSTAICSTGSGCNALYNNCEWQVSFVCEYGGEPMPCDGT